MTTATTNSSGVATSAAFTSNATAGSYTVTAKVTGVSSSANFALTNTSGTPFSIGVTSGTPQTTIISTAFSAPLVATVLDSGNNPVSGASVTFSAPASGPSGVFSNSTNTITVTSSSSGQVSVTLGANATAGGYTVSAKAAGVATGVSFTLTNSPGIPASITPASGTPQSASINTAFAQPLVATVRDSGGNLLSGISVTFTAPASGQSGTFANSTNSTTASTNAQGQATASLFSANGTLGAYTVLATVSGLQASASFSLTNTQPLITALAPSSGSLGQTLNVLVTGQNTHFLNGSTTAYFGTGITVNSVTVAGATSATANVTVAPTTTLGYRTVTLSTGSEAAAINSGFLVTQGSAAIVSVLANQGGQGQLLNIAVVGSNTNFQQNVTSASFGPNIGINSVTVTDLTHATVNISISGNATLGAQNVSMTTGGEIAGLVNGFTVVAGTPQITVVNPSSGNQGDTADSISLTGQSTHWVQGTTTASFGQGITVSSLTVTSPTTATAVVALATTAQIGNRTVTLTTGSEVAASTANAFQVLAGITTATLNPNNGVQGASPTIIINGAFTNFTQGVTSVNFGGDISAGTVTVNGPLQASVPIQISTAAAVGQRTVTISTGSQVVQASFTVLAGQPIITSITSNSGIPGATPTISITGNFTSWVSGTTLANFGPGISVGGAAAGTAGPVTVNNSGNLTAHIAIQSGATLGPRNLVISTGSEQESAANGFTVLSCTTTPPTWIGDSPVQNATGVPLNTTFQVIFNAPLDRTTLNTSDFVLFDNTTNLRVAATVSLDASGRIMTLIPDQLLAVGRQYYTEWGDLDGTNILKDTCGNNLSAQYFYITTAFSTDVAGPALLSHSPLNGDTNVPENGQVVLQFSEPINQLTPAAGVVVTTGGSPVPGSFTFSPDYSQVTFSAGSTLQAATTYTVSYTSALLDNPGNALTNPGSFSFTTGSATDTTHGSVISTNPLNGEIGVGINVTPTVHFSKLVDPLTVTGTNFYLVEANTGHGIQATPTVSADRMSATLTPAQALQPGTYYYFYLDGNSPYVLDLAGNYINGSYTYFYTGSGAISSSPTVVQVSPPNAGSGAPVNSQVQVRMSAVIDPASVGQNAITVSTGGSAVAGTVTVANDSQTLTFVPSANLAISTSYAVAVGGFKDPEGNAVTPFTSSFSTGSSSAPVSGAFGATATPANGTTITGNSQQIVVTFGRAINPVSVANIQVADQSNNYYNIAGSWTVNGAVATFTPANPYPANAIIRVYTQDLVRDLAGNTDNASVVTTFTAGSGADLTAPSVTSVTPPNGSTGVGRNQTIVLTFSKSINQSTVTANTLQLFNGDSYIGTGGFTFSADNRSVSFTQTTPPSTTITIVANAGVQDLSGNSLVPFQSQYTTSADIPSTVPQVVTMRPGNGTTDIPQNAVITLFTNNSPLNPSTVPGALYVSQNGILVNGSLQLTGNNQAIEFTPSAPFAYGALVQVYLQPTALDIYGNAVQAYSGRFTVQGNPASVAPQLIAVNPISYSSNVALNVLPQLEFDQALLASTVNSNSVRLVDGCTGLPVAGTASLTGAGNNVVQFQPQSALTALCNGSARYYYFELNSFGGSSTVSNLDGIAAPSESPYFYMGNSRNSTPPSVLSVAPANATTGVGVNGVVVVTFSAAVDPISVTGSTIMISGASQTVVPSSISFNAGNTAVTITPQAPLPAGTLMTVAINGVTDPEGNAVASSSSTFSTGAAPDTTQPTVTSYTPSANQTNVPTNAVVVVQFSEQMALSTINPSTFYLADNLTNLPVPSTLSFGSDLKSVTLVPSAPLSIDRLYYFQWLSGATDLTGNPLVSSYIYFTTASVASPTIPQVTGVSPAAALSGVPTNTVVQVQFNEPIQPTSLSQVTLSTGGQTIAASAALASGDQLLLLTPGALLQGNTTYTVTVAGVLDFAGHAIAAPFTSSFSTGLATDIAHGSIIATNPLSNETGVGTNVTPTVHFSKKVNPLSASSVNFSLTDATTGRVVQATVAVSADSLSATLTPAQPLQPNTQYYFYLNGASPYLTDIAGNYFNGSNTYFYTGSAAITSGPTVVQISPTSSSTGTPVNTQVKALLSAAIDPTTVAQNAITVTAGGSSVAGTLSVASDSRTLTFVPSANLAASTSYAVTVSGFKDPEGNPVTSFSSSFTTGSSSAAVTGGFGALSVSPANNTTITNNSQQIIITFARAINPETVGNIQVADQSNSYYNIAGSWGVSGATATFTPAAPYPANSLIRVYTQDQVQDFAGNTDNASVVTTFTAGTSADTTPPTVTSVTPVNGTTGVGLDPTVVLTFSESLNPSTVTNLTVQLFAGDTFLNVSPSISADNRTVTFTTNNLPANTVITVAATPSIQDLSGNPLTNFQSQFTTGAVIPPQSQGPAVVSQRPGNGATIVPRSSVITLFVSGGPLDTASVQGALHVAQNGTAITGTTLVNANGAIEFTPGSNLLYGALIQIFLDQTVKDVYGNPLTSAYSGSFTVQGDPASVAPQLTATNPVPYSSNNKLNSVFRFQFNQPLLASTVNSNSVQLVDGCTNLPVAGTVSLTGSGNNVVQFQPQSALLATCNGSPRYYYYDMNNFGGSSTVTNSNGIAAPGESPYFYMGTTSDTTTPTVLAVGPPNNATGVGVNASIWVEFSKPIDPTSVDGTTVQISGGSQTVTPLSISFDSTGSMAKITPLAPLPPSTLMTVSINGVSDPEGNVVTTATSHFTTGAGLDLTVPSVVAVSLVANDTIPTNTGSFTVEFSEPMDPLSVNTTTMYLYDTVTGSYLPGSVSASSDGRTFSFLPGGTLPTGHLVYLQVNGSWDLTGNSVGSPYWYFTIGSGPDTTPPTVLEVSPLASLTNVSTTAPVQIEFSKEISASSLAGVQLLQGGNPVAATVSLSRANSVVTLTPANLLLPNTTYTVSVSGVPDVQGTVMASTFSSSFTTGAGVNLTSPTVVSLTPANGTISVSANIAPQILFSAPMDPLTCDFGSSNGIQLQLSSTGVAVPTTNTLSADGKTLTLTPAAPLTSGSNYRISVYYYSSSLATYVTDAAGNRLLNSSYAATFTVQ